MSDLLLPDVVTFTKSITEMASHAQHAAAGPTADQGALEEAIQRHAVIEAPPMVVDDFGYLRGKNVVQVPSKRTQPLAIDLKHVEGIVWHWTDTAPGTGLVLAHNAIELPKPGQHVGSWHVAIDADGKIYQSASFKVGTWHAGGPSACRFQFDPHHGFVERPPSSGLSGANSYFAGIELVNVGEVRYVALRGWLGWPFGNAKEEAAGNHSVHVPEELVVEHQDWNGHPKHYMAFPPAQVLAAKRVAAALIDSYELASINGCCSYGHHDIDPERREDPGPMWMLNILPQMLGEIEDGDVG